jgi:uncharacterized protein
MSIRRYLLLCCMTLGIAGCHSGVSRLSGPSTPGPDPEAQALIQAGDLQGALQRYERLARAGKNSDHWRLEAADASLRAGNTRYARTTAGTIDPKELSSEDQDRLLLLESRLDLNEGDARSAIAHLNSLSESSLSEIDRRNYRLLRSSALNQLGDMKGSAQERIALGRQLSKPQDLARNDEAIFDSLNHLKNADLGATPKDDRDMAGWLALTQMIRTTPKADRRKALLAWRDSYPNHPVSSEFLGKHLGKSSKGDLVPPPAPSPAPLESGNPQGTFIAVLLPLTGNYAKASDAIRLGLDTAYQGDGRAGKPRLEYIDTTGGSLTGRIQDLETKGAVGFIGPLIKDEVSEVAAIKDLKVPVVALNQVTGDAPLNLIEFGLTPEIEIDQVAAEIWAEGGRSAAILIPNTPFGQRLGQHFDAVWRKAGGTLLGQVSFTPRSEHLGEISRDLPAMPKDGFVMMITDPEDARAIAPNLVTASQVPVWTPGKAYDGRAESPANAALNNVNFCDMPFLLAPENGGAQSAQTLLAKAAPETPDAGRLIAMGLDAYHLFAEFRTAQKPDFKMEGATGVLRIGSDRKVSRQLTCARFDKALPIVQGLAPEPRNP